MAIELYWDNDEQTVMLCEFEGRWNWDEMFVTLDKIKKITDKAEREISAIVDVRGGMNMPGGSLLTAANFEHAKKMLKMGEHGTGPIVVVGANNMIRMAYEAVAGINKRATSNVFFADSVKQARAILEQRQPVREAMAS